MVQSFETYRNALQFAKIGTILPSGVLTNAGQGFTGLSAA